VPWPRDADALELAVDEELLHAVTSPATETKPRQAQANVDRGISTPPF
jgi:hypothetical protein